MKYWLYYASLLMCIQLPWIYVIRSGADTLTYDGVLMSLQFFYGFESSKRCTFLCIASLFFSLSLFPSLFFFLGFKNICFFKILFENSMAENTKYWYRNSFIEWFLDLYFNTTKFLIFDHEVQSMLSILRETVISINCLMV